MVENEGGGVDKAILEGVEKFKKLVAPMTPEERKCEAAGISGALMMSTEILRFIGIAGLGTSSEEAQEVLFKLAESVMYLQQASWEGAKILKELEKENANH